MDYSCNSALQLGSIRLEVELRVLVLLLGVTGMGLGFDFVT